MKCGSGTLSSSHRPGQGGGCETLMMPWIGRLPLLENAPRLFSSIVVSPPTKLPGEIEYWRTLRQ